MKWVSSHRGRRGRRGVPLRLRRSPLPWADQRATWDQARPSIMAEALRRAMNRASGNWFVVADSRDVRADRPIGRTVAGTEVVLWRDGQGSLHAGPGACPHLGAPLKDSAVHCGTLICHWHGLALDGAPFAGWEPWPTFDDGVLVWLRMDRAGGEIPTERPVVGDRPSPVDAISAVYTGVGACEPQDIVANRLDPWHGAWLHPYSFVDLEVLSVPEREAVGEEDALVVQVSFKVAGRAVVPVKAVFTAPGPRTVVMRIVEGEGTGSVVETHATPLNPTGADRPRTAVVEAVVATSDRRGFAVARAVAPLLRPAIRSTAGRLWRDDLSYAERRWQLRSTGRFPG